MSMAILFDEPVKVSREGLVLTGEYSRLMRVASGGVARGLLAISTRLVSLARALLGVRLSFAVARPYHL